MPEHITPPTFGDFHDDRAFTPPRPPDQGTGLLVPQEEPGLACGYINEQPDWDMPRNPRDADAEIRDALKQGLKGHSRRPICGKAFGQGRIGSCAGAAANAGMEVREFMQHGLLLLPNWEVPYRDITGGRDNGSSLPDNLAYLRDTGMMLDIDWPRREHGWKDRPNEEARQYQKYHRIHEFAEIRTALEFRWALVIGGWQPYYGIPGHAVLGTGMRDWNRIESRNSWDTTWGDEGWGTWNVSQIYWGYRVYGFRTLRTVPDHELARIKQAMANAG